jgi:pimeloyl-ACP methyl ester carboxylesterase
MLSSKTFHIAGILTTVFGLDELAPNTKETACLWLLHPRLQTQAYMQPFATCTITRWNERMVHKREPAAAAAAAAAATTSEQTSPSRGLIAVSFDQRNHGSRQVDALANEAWRNGNPRHALDMFSQIHGTAADASILLDYLAAYIFPERDGAVEITQNLVFGISLGGHAAWQVLLRDSRFGAGVVGIGCPDYVRLMADRARLSKLDDWDSEDPSGFLASPSFPKTLRVAVEKYDPAGLIMGQLDDPSDVSTYSQLRELSVPEKDRVSKILDRTLRGKRILLLSGAADRLVPSRCSQPFLTFLTHAIGTYYSDGGTVLEDLQFDGVGHEISSAMRDQMIDFVTAAIEQSEGSWEKNSTANAEECKT